MTETDAVESDLGERPHTSSFEEILVRQTLLRSIGPTFFEQCRLTQLTALVVAPSDRWALPLFTEANRLLDAELRRGAELEGSHLPLIILRTPPSRSSRSSSKDDGTLAEITQSIREGASVIGVFAPGAEPLAVFTDHVDLRIDVERPSTIELAQAIATFMGSPVEPSDLVAANGLDLDALSLSIRPRAPIEETIRRVNALGRPKVDGDFPGLEELAGYGEAQTWGLRLARNIERLRAGDPSVSLAGLPRGVLLVGPPGTGKSVFARALATTAGVPIVVTSASEWLSSGDGHLAAALNAARSSIERARASKPGLLLIDEIDSLRDRDDETGSNASWFINFVNGVLTMVDGVVKTPGLVLIGACNNAARVDKALKRAGRLDTIIEIALPGVEDRRKILALYARGELSDVDLERCARSAEGFSGADLEKAVRDARDAARDADRPLTADDVLNAISPPARISRAELWDQCVHEAGHAVVGAALGFRLLSVQVAMTGDAGGLTRLADGRGLLRDASSIDRLVTMIMAGRAADEIVGDAPTTGAGGDATSDLAKATSLLAARHGSWALGGTLVYRGDPMGVVQAINEDAELRAAVEADLAKRLKQARAVVLDNYNVVFVLADTLLRRRFLTGHEAHLVMESAGLRAYASTGPDRRKLH